MSYSPYFVVIFICFFFRVFFYFIFQIISLVFVIFLLRYRFSITFTLIQNCAEKISLGKCSIKIDRNEWMSYQALKRVHLFSVGNGNGSDNVYK